MVSREYLKTPFFVTAFTRASAGEVMESDERFMGFEAARQAFAAISARPDLFVYFAEVGVFADSKGMLKIDFVTFDTNDLDWWRECSELNRMGRRGFGRPSNHDGYSTEYQPISELNWRL